MQCNIDAKGKAVRLLIGAVSLAIGVGALAAWWWWLPDFVAALWIGIGASAGGLFAIFEGASGWCALRALGVKTPI